MFLWATDIIIDAFERLHTKHNQKSERLNGLASTYIHKDIYINPSYVLKYFFWPTLTEGPTSRLPGDLEKFEM